jgi:hypothetical protein
MKAQKIKLSVDAVVFGYVYCLFKENMIRSKDAGLYLVVLFLTMSR